MAGDTFTRANETPLAAPWTKVLAAGGDFDLVSNAAAPHSVSTDTLWMYAGTFPNDQFCEAKLTVIGIGTETGIGVAVRCSTGSGGSGYWAVVTTAGTNAVYISKWVNGSYTNIAIRSEFGSAFAPGDLFRLEVAGTTLKVFQNGNQLGADITDSSLSSGNPGIALSSTVTSASLDDANFTDPTAGGTASKSTGTITLMGVQ